jgi:hypothetical protein
MTRSRGRIITLALPLLVLTFLPKDALATSFAQAIIGGTSPLEDNETVSAFVASGANTASSFVHPLAETMGAAVTSDGSVFDVRASAGHSDDWTCGGSCSAVFPPLTLSAGINIDVTLSGDVAKGAGEFDLQASYTLGGDVFSFFANADSTPIDFGASFDGDPATVTMTTDASGNVHLSTSFVRTIICPCTATDAPLFSDSQSISIEMEGKGSIDASHTFTVTLTPLAPGVVLTSSDGRIIGSAPTSDPVPEPASLLLLGSGLAVIARRLQSKRRSVRL